MRRVALGLLSAFSLISFSTQAKVIAIGSSENFQSAAAMDGGYTRCEYRVSEANSQYTIEIQLYGEHASDSKYIAIPFELTTASNELPEGFQTGNFSENIEFQDGNLKWVQREPLITEGVPLWSSHFAKIKMSPQFSIQHVTVLGGKWMDVGAEDPKNSFSCEF